MQKIYTNSFNSTLSIARDLYNSGNFESSRLKFQQCLNDSPNDALLLFEYSCCLHHLGENELCIEILQKLISVDPNNARGYALLGTTYSDLGNREKASDFHFKAIKIDPSLSQSAYGYAKSTDAKLDSEEYQYLISLLENPSLKINHKIRLYFSLSEMHYHNNDYTGQVKYLTTANQLAAQCFPFNAEVQKQNSSRIIHGFSGINDFELNSFENSQRPIFILGLPRSGSTLLEQMLSSHSCLNGIGETDILSTTVSLIRQAEKTRIHFPEQVSKIQLETWQQASTFFKQQLAASRSNQVVDKQLFNFTLAGFAKILNPRCLFIDLRRHPGSQFISCHGILFGENRGFTHSVESFIAAYKNQRKLIEFWKTKFPDNFISVYYENLVTSPK